MEVLVFKTSVARRKHVERLRPGLSRLGLWNFDLDDCDRILRVEALAGAAHDIVALLARYGFRCEELP